MVFILFEHIGAIIRWLIKGCKTSFKNEIEGNFKGKFLSYRNENLAIGIIFAIILNIILILIVTKVILK